MKKFSGVYTAIVTPFTNGEVDYVALKKLIQMQIDAKVSGIVPCGTTGESPTITLDERKKIVDLCVEMAKGKCQVIVGTGTNSTASSIENSKEAEKAGASALLIVNPYYNKPTQEGLYQHFKAIANSVSIPIVVYNIKGRTGVNVETKTLVRLINECKNIIAVKEASGNIEQMKEVIKESPDYFCVLSGDDGITLDLIKAGGDGVISVASNFIPEKMVELVSLALNKENAESLNKELDPFFEGEFIETNPIPIKAAMAMKGLIEEEYRLPMCEMSKSNREKWKTILTEMKLL